MICSTPNATLGAAMRFVASTCLVLAWLAVSDFALAQEQQPTLKEMITGPSKEEQAKEQPAEKAEQKPAQAQKKAQPADPADDFDRGTPRSSVEGFLAAAGDRDYERAAQYLDLRHLRRGRDKSKGSRLAREFKIVLDRILWIDVDLLSTDPQGRADDGLPRYRDRVGTIETPEKTVDILLQRVRRADGVYIWKFSSATVTLIPRLYEQFGYGVLGEVLPAVISDFEFLGIAASEWVGFLVLVVLAYLAALFLTKVTIFFLRRTPIALSHQLERVITGPGLFLLFVVIGRAGLELLGPSVTLRAIMQGQTLLLIAVAWTAVRLLHLFRDRLAERLRRRGRGELTVLLPPLTNALIVIGIFIIVLLWLDNIGFRVTTVLAGLGIGGLAVALAAQKSIENLIGAITLYTARPVRVGEFCRFGDKIGTIEEIGLRSTRVRTLDRTLVSVPNAELVNLHLDNFSKRDKIWYHPQIRLRYETTPDQVRYILVEIQKLLYAHPKVLPDPAHIRFVGFGEYSLDLDVFAYIDVTDYGEFLQVAQDLNLRIMDTVVKAGSSFAVPAQTMYMEQGKGLDQKLAQAAEAQVKEWREQQALYLPSFPQERIAQLAGSLDYPPIGSSSAAVRT